MDPLKQAKMNTHLIAANKIAQHLRDVPGQARATRADLLYVLMILLDEARQLAGEGHQIEGEL